MKILIDDRQADTDARSVVPLTVSSAVMGNPEQEAEGYTVAFALPLTAANAELMGVVDDVHAAGRFNDEIHVAKVELNGSVVAEGVVQLVECVAGPGVEGYYRMALHIPPRELVRYASEIKLSSLFPDFSVELGADAVRDSWTSDSAVKFLPVLREKYEPEYGSEGYVPPERVLTMEDYHPFVNVAAMLRKIFADAGYTFESDFVDGDFFRSLYMSGNYPWIDIAPVKEKMDFRAARFGPATAYASYLGRVVANPYANYNTIGNIVDTADPAEVCDGVKAVGVFDNGGCFRKVDERVAFVPQSAVRCGFRYAMKYVTGYKIKDAATLTGFDTFYLGNGESVRYGITNRFADRKGEFRANKDFMCIVAEHQEGRRYRLVAKRITNASADPENLKPEDYVAVTVAEFTSRTAVVSTAVAGTYAGLTLYYGTGATANTAYAGEWMLYDGYVQETGVTEVEVTLTSRAEELPAGRPKYFDMLFWGGAEEGMRFTLTECALSPVFHAHPSEGATVSFGDIMAHDATGMELVNAVTQMFNLCFLTDETAKKVIAAPRGELLDGPVLDWSGRVDFSKPVTIRETGADSARTLTWRYRGGDWAVARFNSSGGGKFGSWSAGVNNVFATDSEKVYENPLFTPSLNSTRSLASAMSANLMNVGTRSGGDDEDNLNFPAKIARYFGVVELAPGERWSWPSNGTDYPLVAFHRPEDGFTLCFEDRDGAQGLHRYRDRDIEALNSGRRLTAWLRLGEEDMEALMLPNVLRHDMRAHILLRIGGEPGYWRLEEVRGYDPAQASTECVFVKD